MSFNKWPQRDSIKNYFPVPNEVFHLALNPGEIAVYSYLLYCEDRKTYQCYPSYKTIGKAVGMSANTVSKHVAGLEEKQLIATEATIIHTKDGRSRNGNLLYTIRPIQAAIDHYNRQQLLKADAERQRKMAEKKLERNRHRTPPESPCGSNPPRQG